MAMNNAHTGLGRQSRLVEKFIDASRGLFDSAADDVDFRRRGFFARLGVYSDRPRARGSSLSEALPAPDPGRCR